MVALSRSRIALSRSRIALPTPHHVSRRGSTAHTTASRDFPIDGRHALVPTHSELRLRSMTISLSAVWAWTLHHTFVATKARFRILVGSLRRRQQASSGEPIWNIVRTSGLWARPCVGTSSAVGGIYAEFAAFAPVRLSAFRVASRPGAVGSRSLWRGRPFPRKPAARR